MANSNKPRTAEEINAEVIRKRRIQTVVRYVVLIIVGIFMVYPLVWMVGATFKDNNEIFARRLSSRSFPLRLQLTVSDALSSQARRSCTRS